ncbi:MAG: hypothetical protein Q8M11_21245 [Sulfuritalea sp.]|nr:hypothetical protein [Sulfuritalea sp.]MDP1984651.1 hypothetical protein [Sulfuritalea sp.]
METINLSVIAQELPPEIARLLPETAEVYDGRADNSAARVLCLRQPRGEWLGWVLQVADGFGDLAQDRQRLILMHELAHAFTASAGEGTSQPAHVLTDGGHDRHWLRIYALLAARCGLDIRDYPAEVDYLKSFGLTGLDIDAAMVAAGGCWPKINDNVFVSRIVEIADQRSDAARAGWRRQANLGWAILAGAGAAVAGAEALAVTLGAR